ncbi:conserved hypothetical protein [Halorhabdus utahensis DSM 12940]|uniref:Uncharacterized protein n=1 Tax=Halorhabdus utahensis (strain DSM 12940 / JCM 11049 / AX-2) TaxID=519442 RepID=C7NT76_HALUD|nr:DUF5796 family protein [Halorhabdus utahensis]ACV13187.1 conserved hypothetical protein [Halorhabdus utahensis DSM 12940]
MSIRTDVPPETIGVELTDEGVVVEYADGRETFYHGIPNRAEGAVRTMPGKQVHVLVTDESETAGVLVYVNDRITEAEILESTGVGRVVLEPGEKTTVFPGVRAANDARRIVVEADFDAVDGRVFVFEEDEMGERSFELVPEGRGE